MVNKSKWELHARLIALGKEKKSEEARHEVFTDEAQQMRRSRSNIPFYPRYVYFNRQASKDGIKHFVDGIGDTNPLFRDEEYARKTKYGGIIAPGSYLYTVQLLAPGGGGPGIHGWYVGGQWEWYKPIFAGDEFKTVCILRELIEKKGKIGAGRTWIDFEDVIYINQKGEIVGKEYGHVVMGERTRAKSAKKYRNIPKPVYTREDWIHILEMYDKEELRGNVHRYWEDVQTGDQVGPMIKGPLSVRDEIAWLMGAGSPFFRAHKIEYDFEMRHPRVLDYIETEEADTPGDIPELVYILNPFARAIGVERVYDYGHQRMSWLCNFFTNWMGNDSWLWKMDGDLRAFNQSGDITTFEGRVTKKYIDDGKCCVDIEAWAKNQRDEWSMPPHISTIILPSREHGQVKYPDPPQSLFEEVKRARPLDALIKEGKI
ncbi:MAG: MaoC family dehydratase N-terminal domain-containing protein [Thermodesulfobacteriota bacterium]|nr:MaoC family dehydratase N-terminal domain-containing protein [Thermodesulfobacteriota bacterium]